MTQPTGLGPGTTAPATPRAALPGELGEAARLADLVFRPGKAVTMGDLFPTLWSDENAQNIRVVVEDGRIVSQIGLWVSEVVLRGTRIPSASMGAVCSLEEVRGRGYGTSLLMDSFRHCDSMGVDIITISGGRGLYRTNECRSVGRVDSYTFGSAVAASFACCGGPRLSVRRAGVHDVPAMCGLHSAEAVRFSRTADDFSRLFAAETFPGVHDLEQQVFISSRAGQDVAYVAVMLPRSGKRANCFEYAGDRGAVLSAVAAVAGMSADREVQVAVSDWDVTLTSLLAAHGLLPSGSGSLGGTQFVTNPRRLFGRLERYFAERMPASDAAELSRPEATADGRGLTLRVRGQALQLDTRAKVVDLILGTDKSSAMVAALGGPLGQALSAGLPLPFPNPECINYV